MAEQTGVRMAGIGVSPGIAFGPVARMRAPVPSTSGAHAVVSVDSETLLAREAMEAVAVSLERLAASSVGDATAVLSAEALMARDPVLGENVVKAVRAGARADVAITTCVDEFCSALAAAGPYMAARIADLEDIRNRAVAHCRGVPMPAIPDPGRPFVLVASDLSPADTVTLDATYVLAIVTEKGGPTSHTAILARSLGIPAIVACSAASELQDAVDVLVDADAGSVTIAERTDAVDAALARQAERRSAAAASSGPGLTSDGHHVQLLVNLGDVRELSRAAAEDSEGVGLFRTEFLYLDRDHAPGVEEQRAIYRRVFEAFEGRKVIVRTLDAGADKPLRFVTGDDEPNPALGIRGFRTARRHPELLEQQLDAIAAAAAGSTTDVWVMAPMVSTPYEAESFAQQARGRGLRTVGAMIEVPAAALRAHHVLARCDFVSLGTNDLAQYAYAADRMTGELADLLDPWQPALLDLVRLTAEAGQALGKPVGVCGEAASDPRLALLLVGLGVTSLSMAPAAVAAVRSSLAGVSLGSCREMASIALDATDAHSARDGVAHLWALRTRRKSSAE